MRTFHRLHLSSLLLRPGYPNPTGFTFPCCPLCYSLPCRNLVTPIKSTLKSESTDSVTVSLGTQTHRCFWWRWGESNSRPEHFSLCFIQQYNYLLYHFFKNFASCGGVQSSGFNTLPSARLITLPVALSILDRLLRATSSHAPCTS
jgi:hypothetical protein